MTIRGIVFDFDGIIVDTEETEYGSWVELYRSYGAEITFLEWSACLGTTQDAFDAVAELEKKIGYQFPDPDEIWRQQAEHSLSLANQQPPLPGVLDALERARQLGLGLAVASSSERKWVVGHLDRLGLTPRFSGIFTKDDVPNVKPDPELYLMAARHLGISPHEALAFEDSPNGIRSAKAAGMICVAVPNPLSTTLDLSDADFSIPSFAAHPLDDILARANQLLTTH